MKVEKITPQIAALYLGQTADLYWCNSLDVMEFERTGVLTSIHPSSKLTNPLGFDCNGQLLWYRLTEVKLHLRRIESITEEEAREIYFIKTGRNWIDVYADTVSVDSCLDYYLNALDYDDIDAIQRLIGEPAVWLYLLGKGFDLFGLIDAGLAKDVGK